MVTDGVFREELTEPNSGLVPSPRAIYGVTLPKSASSILTDSMLPLN